MVTHTRIDFRLGTRRHAKDPRNIINHLVKTLRAQGNDDARGRYQGADSVVFNVSPSEIESLLEREEGKLKKWGVTYTLSEVEMKEPEQRLSYDELEQELQKQKDHTGTLEKKILAYETETAEDRILAVMMKDEVFARLQEELDKLKIDYNAFLLQRANEIVGAQKKVTGLEREIATITQRHEDRESRRSAELTELEAKYNLELRTMRENYDEKASALQRKLNDKQEQLVEALKTTAQEDEKTAQGKFEHIRERYDDLLSRLESLGVKIVTKSDGTREPYERSLRKMIHPREEGRTGGEPAATSFSSKAQEENTAAPEQREVLPQQQDPRIADYERIVALCAAYHLSSDENPLHGKVREVNFRRLEKALQRAKGYSSLETALAQERARHNSCHVIETGLKQRLLKMNEVLRINEQDTETYLEKQRKQEEKVTALKRELEDIKEFQNLSAEELLAETLKCARGSAFALVAKRYQELFPEGVSTEQEIAQTPELEYLIQEIGIKNIQALGISLQGLASADELEANIQQRTKTYVDVVDRELHDEFLLADAYILRHGLAAPKTKEAELLGRQKEVRETYVQAEMEWNSLIKMAQTAEKYVTELRKKYATAQKNNFACFSGPEVSCYAYTLQTAAEEKIAFLLPLAEQDLQDGAAIRTIIGLGEALQGRGKDVKTTLVRKVLRVDVVYDKGKMPTAEMLPEIIEDIEHTMNLQTSFGRLGMRANINYLGELFHHDQ